MTLMQILLCLVFPPLAVMNKGCGTLLLTTAATCLGWVPGCVAAAYFCWRDNKREAEERERQRVIINITQMVRDPDDINNSVGSAPPIQDAEIVSPPTANVPKLKSDKD